MCFVLYIDVLSVSIRFSISFCIYYNIFNYLLQRVSNNSFSNFSFSEMIGVQYLFCFVLVAPTALGPILSC